MSFDRGDVTGFDAGQTAIVAGVTNALLIQDPAWVNGGLIKYVSGGSLLLMRAPGLVNGAYGGTYAAATLVANYNNGKFYVMDGAPVAYDGAARYYLAAIGATAVVQVLRGLDAGYSETSALT